MDGIDIVGVDPRNERCLRLIGIFSQIFTTYVWNYSWLWGAGGSRRRANRLSEGIHDIWLSNRRGGFDFVGDR